jgi:hypothetical protein
LRDFIISLDRSKADKLRYKLEDQVVKIFITPYKSSISEKDLDFSQGDFNVDAVLALGVHVQEDLDQAIVSHGRILHDATIATLNIAPGGQFGSINCLDTSSSSLSEMTTRLIDIIDKKLIDNQIATAFLTGIVAETARFSNEKTTPRTMAVSSELMAAGANQQLVATKLEEPKDVDVAEVAKQMVDGKVLKDEGAAEPQPPVNGQSRDGTLEISHDDAPNNALEDLLTSNLLEGEQEVAGGQEGAAPLSIPTQPVPVTPQSESPQIHIDEQGQLQSILDRAEQKQDIEPVISRHAEGPKMVLTPPTLGGQLTANTMPEGGDNGPLTLPAVDSVFLDGDAEREQPSGGPPQPILNATAAPSSNMPIKPSDSMQDILGKTSPESNAPVAKNEAPPTPKQDEQIPPTGAALVQNPPQPEQPSVTSAHETQPTDKTPDVEAARNAVELAMAGMPPDINRPDPLLAMGAQPALQVEHPDAIHGAPKDEDTDAEVPPVPPPIMPPTAG